MTKGIVLADHETRVYELDADGVVADLLNALVERGNNVVEQAPAGVWWFKTDKDKASLTHEVAELFFELLARNLRSISQDN